MKIRLIRINVLILITSVVYSQNNKLVDLPQSPTVSSLTGYTESCINYSTGDLKLEIPIFTINVDDFEFPIKLYYDYKGYNPMDMPTQVGYGWNIQDTGFIGVQVRGVGDFKENGYVFGKTGYNMIKPLLNGDYSNDRVKTNNILACIRDFGCDGEPDKYNILLPKLNSTFYINEDGNTYTVPKDQNKIYYELNSNFPNFKVRDVVGNEYKFEESENFINTDCINYLNLSDVKNSYCLTQIITNKNKLINYTYETKQLQYKPIDQNPYDYSENYQNGGCNLNASPSPTFCYKIDTKYIKQISYSNSLVEFSYEDKDVFTSLLKEINVKNSLGVLVNKFIFYYNTDNQLIKIERNNNGATIILNEFEYFGTRQKINNSQYQPEGIYNYQLNLAPLKRSDNSRSDKFKNDLNGALKKITYPTKGFSEFLYEPHAATNNIYDKSIEYWNDNSVYNTSESCISTENQDNSKIITIPYAQVIKVVVSASAPGTTGISEATAHADFDVVGVKTIYSSLQLGPDFNSNVFNSVLNAYSYHEASYIHSDTGGGTSFLYVPAGNYTCNTVTSWGNYGSKPRASVTVSYNTVLPLNYYVSGFRLSSVKKHDLINNVGQINYNYNDEAGRSTARIKRPSRNNYRFIKQCNPTIERQVVFYPENTEPRDYIFMNSKFSSPNLSINPVIYKSIIEEYVDISNTTNGKTKYTFVTDIDRVIEISNSVFNYNIPKVNIDNLGALSEKITYDASGTVVESYKCNYSFVPYSTTNLFAYGLPVFCRETFNREYWPLNSFDLFMGIQSTVDHSLLEKTAYITKAYMINDANYLKLNETTNKHFKNGLLTNTDNYFYNENSGQLISQTSTNSNNETLETKYYYPQDLPNEPYVNDLILKNSIGTPLKTETFRNTVKLSEQKTEYAKTTDNLLLPKFVYAKKGVGDIDKILDKKITYDQYDNKGNILQYTPESGSPVTIIWGYNQTQPIAKIENATYAQAIAQYSTVENVFRNNLPNAMITTYTYIPLVGIKTITDPKGNTTTYEYDEFNRFKLVKDAQGNILSENQYHYKTN
jgi:YD repeat-containing protein